LRTGTKRIQKGRGAHRYPGRARIVVAAARRAAAPRCRSRSSGESRSARPSARPSSTRSRRWRLVRDSFAW